MDFQFLIDAITAEIEKAPQANLYKERGRLRMMNGDKAGAMQDLRQAMELDPSLLNEIKGEYSI